MDDLDWSDLRYALAIGNAGSLAGAARQLGVNHTTVLRRLDALERHLNARLFERLRSGYQPTEAGTAVLEQARRMGDRADEIERLVLGRDRELTGLLRVTTAFVVMEHLLPKPLAAFARAYPQIEVEVVENAFLVDLSRRHADQAQDPPKTTTVGSRGVPMILRHCAWLTSVFPSQYGRVIVTWVWGRSSGRFSVKVSSSKKNSCTCGKSFFM